MGVEKVLRMALRVEDFAVGETLPIRDHRAARGHLRHEIGVAAGEIAPALVDHRSRRSHLLDFVSAYAQAALVLQVSAPNLREQNTSRIANGGVPPKRDW
jgi:hypothetical protein